MRISCEVVRRKEVVMASVEVVPDILVKSDENPKESQVEQLIIQSRLEPGTSPIQV
jgi:hypothetical protein